MTSMPKDYWGIGLISVGLGCLQVVLDKGQEDDWFASSRIVMMSVIAVVTIIWFVWHEWHHDNPILDLKLFRQRNFRMTTFMMFVLGVVLFATTVLIPQYLQVLLGFTAETAGKALSSGAVVLVFMMPLVGQMLQRGVDPRKMIAVRISWLTALALWHMTSLNLNIDFKTAAMMRVYQTVGLGFLFIPINTLSCMGIPMNKSNQVSGITNLARNLGGSVGISALGTFLARLNQQHQVYLSAHTTAGNPALQQTLDGLTQTFVRQGIFARRIWRQQRHWSASWVDRPSLFRPQR